MKNQTLVYKLNSILSENEKLTNANKNIEKEIQILQENKRNMIPGFTSNTSSSFPMITELQNIIVDYIKITCQDIFFDILQPSFTMVKIVEFFNIIIQHFEQRVEAHFAPAEKKIKMVLKIDKLWDPIKNVLRKAYQTNWRGVYDKLDNSDLYTKKFQELIFKFGFEKSNEAQNRMLFEFMKKTHEITFLCYISDPQIIIDRSQIGECVLFNQTYHDSFDGFIKPKQKCIVILPSFYKKEKCKDTMMVKVQVLSIDYELN